MARGQAGKRRSLLLTLVAATAFAASRTTALPENDEKRAAVDEKKGADGDEGDSGVLLYSRTPALGRHILLDLSITDQSLLSDVEKLQAVFLDAAAAGNLTVIDKKFHKFSPHGVTGILVLAESHMSIHTWPEHHFAALDIFVCGVNADAEATSQALVAALHPQDVVQRSFDRGGGRGGAAVQAPSGQAHQNSNSCSSAHADVKADLKAEQLVAFGAAAEEL